MTSLISVDRNTIRHDAARGGVGFRYSDGARARRAFVSDATVAGLLRVRALTAAQAEGFIRNIALKLALFLANRRESRPNEEVQLSLDDLRQIR
ncbi:hypothetical protein RCO27_10970 [Sphingosinicella sp. LHD-64]|uniref:hypothetical protein n=1 Tax=Sphingosinicella sp. LHD-64 TaxID=3072139 RepID=UPI00280FD981|nr:hypothetical protein [Sphingosinicella sp. LHD-64]MDQ8756750.1 hypothetical protein [Sphingosinicella sp. LHD-64]